MLLPAATLARCLGLAGLVAGLAACSDDASRGGTAARLELRPGDTLFDHLDDLIVRNHPRTNLPPDVLGKVRQLARPEGWTLPADAWRGGEPVPEARSVASELAALGPARQWFVKLPVDLDLDLGDPWFTHRGVPVGRETSADAGAPLLLFDKPDRTLFWWDVDKRRLVATSDHAPGAIAGGYDVTASSELALWERSLAGDDVLPSRGAELARRVALERVERPCLSAPAPSVVALTVDRFVGQALDVRLSVVDLGLELREGRLVRAPSTGDGVTFAVEVIPSAGGGPRRVWSRTLAPGASFVAARVELGAYAGSGLTLRLVTEPGPAGDRRFDYGLWSELRVVGEPERRPDRPHVVLIDVDTLRADRLGCYGYERPTSPRLDAWAAAQATVYTDSVSANNWTLPSTVSLLTGLGVSQHGVLGYPRRITPAMEPLAATLRAAGYETYARTDGAFLGPEHGFSVGFDVFDYDRRPDDVHQREGWGGELDMLRRRRSERPLFLFLHTYQVHEPYAHDRRFEAPARPYRGSLSSVPLTRRHVLDLTKRVPGGALPPAEARYLNDVYDAAVRRMDDVVGAFVEGLDAAFGDEPYLVVLTSDHGESLCERNEVGHGLSLHREQLAVPLIVRYPGGDRVGPSDRPSWGLDVAPTILELAGLPVSPRLPGTSLLREGPGPRLRLAWHKQVSRAVLHGAHKLILKQRHEEGHGDVAELYDLRADPGEATDIARGNAELVRSLRERLQAFEQRHPFLDVDDPAPGPLDAERLRELAELGYLDEG